MNPYPDYVWYTVEIWKDGEWVDICPECESLKEARSEMVNANCCGHEAAIIKHRTTAEIIRRKDFRPKQ